MMAWTELELKKLLQPLAAKAADLLGFGNVKPYRIIISANPPPGISAEDWAGYGAVTIQGTIWVNAADLNKKPREDLRGMLAHEYTHILTGADQEYEKPKWQEGVADWVRDKLGLPSGEGLQTEGHHALKGYQDTAKFLEWLNGQYGARTVAHIAQEMADGTFTNESFREITGDRLKVATTAYKTGADVTTNEPTGSTGGGGGGGAGGGDETPKKITDQEVHDYSLNDRERSVLANLMAYYSSQVASVFGYDKVTEEMQQRLMQNVTYYYKKALVSGATPQEAFQQVKATDFGWDKKTGEVTASQNGQPVTNDGDSSTWTFDPKDAGGTETETKVSDYLANLPSGIPLNHELRALAKKAADQQWSMAEWKLAYQGSDAYFERNAVSYRGVLQNYGIPLTPNTRQLINEAIRNGYSGDEFLYFLRQTKEYHQEFPGIFDRNGELRMSEQEYISLQNTLETLGKQYGYQVKPEDVAQTLRKGITAEDFEDRLRGLQRVNEYGPAMKEFRDTLAARGIIPKGKELTRREMYDFVTERAPQSWYKIWEEASARSAAVTAGLDVKRHAGNQYLDISRQQILNLIHRIPGQQSEGDLVDTLSQVADDFLAYLPESKIRGYGLSRRDILAARTGGHGAAEARAKIERLRKEIEAGYKPEATGTIYGTEAGPQSMPGPSKGRAGRYEQG